MTNPIDIKGKIEEAINGAFGLGHPTIVGYVDQLGKPHVTIRGSTRVTGPTEVGLWARDSSSGLVPAVDINPAMTILFHGRLADGSGMFFTLDGRAHVDAGRNREVYDAMGEPEQTRDPNMKGVAVFIDIEKVRGLSEEGPIEQG